MNSWQDGVDRRLDLIDDQLKTLNQNQTSMVTAMSSVVTSVTQMSAQMGLKADKSDRTSIIPRAWKAMPMWVRLAMPIAAALIAAALGVDREIIVSALPF